MNNLTYPFKVMRLTQSYVDGNHLLDSAGVPRDYPIDESGVDSGRDWFYCPCDEMRISRLYGSQTVGYHVWLESTSKVNLANGNSDYVSILAVHCNADDFSKLKLGQVYKRGSSIFREGTTGKATGNHCHFSVGTGKASSAGYWRRNTIGAWVLTTSGIPLKPEEAFYVNDNFTTVLNSRGLIFKHIQDLNVGYSLSNTESVLSKFITLGMSHKREKGDWAWSTASLTRGQPWSAAFISSCAKSISNIAKSVIYTSNAATSLASGTVKYLGGKWLPGPGQNGASRPQPGDLVLYRWEDFQRTDPYSCDHIGIVYNVDSTYIYTLEGDSGGENSYTSIVDTHMYSLAWQCISGYVRPKWSKLGVTKLSWDGITYASLVNYNVNLYDGEESTSYDSTLREIGYYDNSMNKPSIESTDIRLSVINYTSIFSSFITSLNLGLPRSDVDISGLTNVQQIVVNTLIAKGLNTACSIGILANIFAESGCRAEAVGDNGTSFGICQWHASRGQNMKKYVGNDWSNNLSGQLDFLWYELVSNYRSLLTALSSMPSTLDSAKVAADLFVRQFERPAEVENASLKRQQYAESFWNKLKM